MRILESSFMIMYVYNNVWVVSLHLRAHANEEKTSFLFISDCRPQNVFSQDKCDIWRP